MHQYDSLMNQVGKFGKFQKWVCALLIFSTLPNGFWVMIGVFIQATPEHYCKIPELQEYARQNNVSLNSKQYEKWLNASIPYEQDKTGVGDLRRSQCLRNSTWFWDGTDIVANTTSNRSTIKCDRGWVYITDPGQVTIVTEWDLVCDMAYANPLAISVYSFGVLVGSLVSGIVSDRYGRRPVFLVGTLVQFISMLLLGFSYNYIMYVLNMFFSGLNGLVNYVAAYVIATEISPYSYRSTIGNLENVGFTIGYMTLAPIAYFMPNWRVITKFAGICGVLFIPYYWWLPESPRWLISKGKLKEAEKLFSKIAKVNGKSVTIDKQMLAGDSLLDEEENSDSVPSVKKYNYIDLVRNPVIRLRTIVMCLLWFVASLVYYCINLNTSNLGGNSYINCFISAAVEIPALIVCVLFVEHIGRRISLFGFFFLSGFTCLLAPFLLPASQSLMITSAMISKFAMTISYAIVYFYCCEMYPTLMRNMSIGVSSTSARFSGILAPYLVYAGQQLSIYVPYVVMGMAGISAAVSCLLLPETKKVPLPNNMEEAIALQRYSFNLCCNRQKGDSRTKNNSNEANEAQI